MSRFSVHSQYNNAAAVITFQEFEEYFIDRRPVITDYIIKNKDFKAKMDQICGDDISKYSMSSTTLQYTVDVTQKDWFMLSFLKNDPLKQLEVTHAIKSREKGGMKWFERMYFRVEGGKVIFVKLKNNHI